MPAHKVVLAQRSPVFNAMFLQEDGETKKRSITLTEPSLEAFKLFLEFVYTGVIDFERLEIDIVLGVLQLAITYQMTQLEGLTVNHLDSIINVQNVCDILNGAIKFEQATLIAHCLERVKSDFSKILNSEDFKKLSTKALKHVLKEVVSHVPDLITFRAFVEWMKANPSESTHFPELLKHIKLDSIALFELINAVRPSNLIDANDFMDVVYQQSIASTPLCKKQFDYPDGNVLTPKNNVRVISGGASTFFMNLTKGTLKHQIGSYENITIDLERRYILNSLVMKLSPGDKSYWIDVSTDYEHWTRIIDYSKYTCRSTQNLHFNDRAVRYIRICGTAPANATFEIVRLETSYTMQPFQIDPQTTTIIPFDNVALSEKKAIVIQKSNWTDANAIINGCTSDGSYTHHKIGGKDAIIVQLPQPYFLGSMNLQLWNTAYHYSYHVDVSVDKVLWTRVFSEEGASNWRFVTFEKQPVVFIKLTGVKSGNGFFNCQHLECPAITKL